VDRTDGRLSLAVLAAGAALVLAAGGAWWVAADPEIDAEPAQAIEPVVVPEAIEPGQVEDGLESFLPEFPNTIQRHVGRLDPDATYVLHVPSVKDGDYRLQYVCLGPGDLSVRIKGTAEGEMLHQVDCEGNLSTFGFVAAVTDVVVEVHRPGPEPADVGVQVIDVE
jgi:Family of unknown function (DUF6023)